MGHRLEVGWEVVTFPRDKDYGLRGYEIVKRKVNGSEEGPRYCVSDVLYFVLIVFSFSVPTHEFC